MRAQLSFEFIVILSIVVVYLSLFFRIYSDTESSLHSASEKMLLSELEKNLEFSLKREGIFSYNIPLYPGTEYKIEAEEEKIFVSICGENKLKKEINSPKKAVSALTLCGPHKELNIKNLGEVEIS